MMTGADNVEDPVERSKVFDLDLEGKRLPSLDELSKDFRRLRRTSHWLQVISAILLVTVLTVVLLAVRANQAAQKAVRAQNAVTVTCISSNAVRATEKQVWDVFLAPPLPPSQPRLPARQAALDLLKVKVDAQLQPRSCDALADGQIVTPSPTSIPSPPSTSPSP